MATVVCKTWRGKYSTRGTRQASQSLLYHCQGRHLTQDLQKTNSILRDKVLTSSREALEAARKHLKSEGKGKKTNAALGDTDPVMLQQMLWWLIATYMGMRGRDEHRQLRFGDFFLGSTTDGHEYFKPSSERGTKTRTEETEKHTNENQEFLTKNVGNTGHAISVPCMPVSIFSQKVPSRYAYIKLSFLPCCQSPRHQNLLLVQKTTTRCQTSQQNYKVTC